MNGRIKSIIRNVSTRTKQYLQDASDRHIFMDDYPRLGEEYLRLKANDPTLNSLVVSGHHFNDRAWRRLGCFLQSNTNLKELTLSYCSLGSKTMEELCSGLQYNNHIESIKLFHCNHLDENGLLQLVPFLANNTSLQKIELNDCYVGPRGLDILFSTLPSISNMEELHLVKMRIGGIDDIHRDEIDVDWNTVELDLEVARGYLKTLSVDSGVLAIIVGDVSLSHRYIYFDSYNYNQAMFVLDKCTTASMRMLLLHLDEQRKARVSSLSNLLKDENSNLRVLDLSNNSINDECATILASSLVSNTKLETLCLDYNYLILGSSLKHFLHLVCNATSINDTFSSNHTLSSLGDQWFNRYVIRWTMGVDNTRLLRASLQVNGIANNTTSIGYIKVMWCHVQRRINLEEFVSIRLDVMPRVLSWIGSAEQTTTDIADIEAVFNLEISELRRHEAIYRILRAMPGLCVCSSISMEGQATLSVETM
eukprot:g7192.t1 g7192   contig24:59332-60768(-)